MLHLLWLKKQTNRKNYGLDLHTASTSGGCIFSRFFGSVDGWMEGTMKILTFYHKDSSCLKDEGYMHIFN
jgi:hypothetical protein